MENDMGSAMQRLVKAFRNSARAFGRLARSETAFQQELVLLLLSLPAGWFLASTWGAYALLVGSLIVLVIVEVLNTAVEATCNALSREFNADIQFAKDCGSLAVLLAVMLAAGVWIVAFAERFGGAIS
jgi:diacylglycerol kinase (ATP)